MGEKNGLVYSDRLLFFDFEIFVGGILVSVDLHVGDVPLLRRGRLVHLHEALALRRPRRAALRHRHPDDDGGHQGHAGERQREVDAPPVLAAVHLTPHGVRLRKTQN